MSRQTKTALVLLFSASIAACSDKVPDLAGKTQDEAAQILANASLELGSVEASSGEGTPGTIIDQEPRAGEKVPADKMISIVVRAGGAAPVLDGPRGLVTVPDLAGKTVEDAEPLLTASGLALGEQVAAIHEGAPGRIFHLNPAAGFEVEAGTAVDVTVAADVMVTVPAIIGQTQAEAERLVTEARLTVGVIEPRVDITTAAVGSVVDANPSPATRVASGTPVKLFVRQASTTVPRVQGLGSDAAQLLIFQRGLVPVVRYVRTKGRVDQVVSQAPSDGVLVAQQSTVVIRVGTVTPSRYNSHLYYQVAPGGLMRALTGPEMSTLVTNPGH